MRFGDIILVPFSFTDQSAAKLRPAVVVSSDAYNLARRDLIVMPITSQLGGEAFGEVPVLGWRSARLLKPSAIKPILATLERSLVIRILGRLAIPDSAAVRDVLRTIVG